MQEKVILVTGASSGIGRAIATELSGKGHRVFGTSRSTHAANPGFEMLPLDVTDDASVAAAVDAVMQQAGRLDVLINNAGAGIYGAIEDTALDEAHWQMDTNFFGPLRMIKAVLPTMRRQGSGRIITISSMAGMAALPYQAIYSASKFALEGLNEALRLELNGVGVDATTVVPGDFHTGFTSARRFTRDARSGLNAHPMARTLAIIERDEKTGPHPEQVARLVGTLVDAKTIGVRYVVGRLDQRLGMLLKRWMPASWFERIMMATYAIR